MLQRCMHVAQHCIIATPGLHHDGVFPMKHGFVVSEINKQQYDIFIDKIDIACTRYFVSQMARFMLYNINNFENNLNCPLHQFR
jgi:hypothetical protein